MTAQRDLISTIPFFRARFRNKCTARTYVGPVKNCLSWLAVELRRFPILPDWTEENLWKFYDHESSRISEFTGRPLEISTLASILNGLKIYDRMLVEHYGIESAFKLQIPNPPVKPVFGLSRAEHIKLVKFAMGAEDLNYRDRAVCLVCINVGLRPNDLRRLYFGQVDLKTGVLMRVRQSKGGPIRDKILNESAVSELSRMLPIRDAVMRSFFAKHGEDWDAVSATTKARYPLFVSTYKAILSEPDSFRCNTRTLLRGQQEIIKGSEVNYNLRTLRHTKSRRLVEGGAHMRLITEALGHTSMRTAERHYTHQDIETMRDADIAAEKALHDFLPTQQVNDDDFLDSFLVKTAEDQ